MSRKEKQDFGKKMRAGWSEAKLAEWKAGWKAKSANWKKKKGVAEPADPHFHSKKGRAMSKINTMLGRQTPAVEEGEVLAPPPMGVTNYKARKMLP